MPSIASAVEYGSPTGTPPLLEVSGVSCRFGAFMALRDVSFGVPSGALTALIGPNGAGKTTMFNVVAGVIRPQTGRVEIGGRDVTGWRPHRIAGEGVRRTFQNIRLFPEMSALENTVVGMHQTTHYGWLRSMLRDPGVRKTERELRAQARAALEGLGIGHLADRDAGTLAQGQQRLVEIARAAVCEPQLLMLDEPAAGLNETETSALGAALRLLSSRGTTVLLVEHDMRLVMGIADHVVVLSAGEKIAEGAPRAVQANEHVIEAYLGSRRSRQDTAPDSHGGESDA